MTRRLDRRDVANSAIAIGAVATIGAVAILIDGTAHPAGIGVVAYLGTVLIGDGLHLHPSFPWEIGNYENSAKLSIALGSFAVVFGILAGVTVGDSWDVVALIAFLGVTHLAYGGALLGYWANAAENGGASA